MTFTKTTKKNWVPPSGNNQMWDVKGYWFNKLIDELEAIMPSSTELKADTISEKTAANGVTVDGVTLKDGAVTTTALNTMTGGTVVSTNVVEYDTEVTLTASEIVGTTAGCIGHANGAILVAAPGTGKALEFVSAVLIYDYDTAAYTGGGDDTVIQVGVNGGQVASSGAITGANLLEASADKMLRLGCIATELVLVDNSAISLAGTALTQPGTAAGELRVNIKYRVHTTGL